MVQASDCLAWWPIIGPPKAKLSAAIPVVFSYAGFVMEGTQPLRQQLIPSCIVGAIPLGLDACFGLYLLAQGGEILAYVYLALFTLADVNNYNGTFLQQLAVLQHGPRRRRHSAWLLVLDRRGDDVAAPRNDVAHGTILGFPTCAPATRRSLRFTWY